MFVNALLRLRSKLKPLLFFLATLISVTGQAESLCEGALSPHVFQERSGKYAIYLFPFVKTEVVMKNGEPYVWVYRGLRERLSESDSEFRRFGKYMFTTLNPKTATDYLTRTISFVTPKELTVLRMLLPLKKAYVAKREKRGYGIMPGDLDEYIPALENRNYMWLRWRAPQRRKERELVWNLDELEGGLKNPLYELSQISLNVDPHESGEYLSYENWYNTQKLMRDKIHQGAWEPLKN